MSVVTPILNRITEVIVVYANSRDELRRTFAELTDYATETQLLQDGDAQALPPSAQIEVAALAFDLGKRNKWDTERLFFLGFHMEGSSAPPLPHEFVGIASAYWFQCDPQSQAPDAWFAWRLGSQVRDRPWLVGLGLDRLGPHAEPDLRQRAVMTWAQRQGRFVQTLHRPRALFEGPLEWILSFS